MMTTWNITALESIQADESLGPVLTRAYWKASITENGVEVSRSNYVKLTIVKDRDGVLVAPNIDPDNFIQYDAITEQDIVGWVKNILGDEVAVIEQTLADEIRSTQQVDVKPRPVDTPIPWA
jgi:hypothetical protein